MAVLVASEACCAKVALAFDAGSNTFWVTVFVKAVEAFEAFLAAWPVASEAGLMTCSVIVFKPVVLCWVAVLALSDACCTRRALASDAGLSRLSVVDLANDALVLNVYSPAFIEPFVAGCTTSSLILVALRLVPPVAVCMPFWLRWRQR